jgi:thiamine biosynthesis lipoprotein
MVLGPEVGAKFAQQQGIDALFLIRDGDGSVGDLKVSRQFSNEPPVNIIIERL